MLTDAMHQALRRISDLELVAPELRHQVAVALVWWRDALWIEGRTLPAPWQVCSPVRGTVQLEWEIGGRELAVRLLPDGATALILADGRDQECGYLEVVPWLQWLLGGNPG